MKKPIRNTMDLFDACIDASRQLADGTMDPVRGSATIAGLRVAAGVVRDKLEHARLTGRLKPGSGKLPMTTFVFSTRVPPAVGEDEDEGDEAPRLAVATGSKR